jgi:hypothetical protein
VGDSTTEFLFYLDPANAVFPFVGDSVSINPVSGLADLNGTVVWAKSFTQLTGSISTEEIMDFSVSWPEKDNPKPDLSRGKNYSFILVDKNGTPLPGLSPGKCENCFVGANGKFVGPVFFFETMAAFRFRLDISSNLGTFITSFQGEVTETDLVNFSTIPGQETWLPVHIVRLVWNGLSSDGNQIGSGAYVVKGAFYYSKNPKLGIPAFTKYAVKKFGYFRQ